jgi:hypothetical protein
MINISRSNRDSMTPPFVRPVRFPDRDRAALDESMSRFFNNMQAAFERALRPGARVHIPELFPALIGLGVLLLAPAVFAQKLPTPTSTGQNTRGTPQLVLTATASKLAQQDPMPEQAPSAGTPERIQPKPPLVTYEAGQLTITAENSKLSDILSSLRACMGADIDLPASASGERIWARFGPGPARKVLAMLLSGTKLDYIIQASDTDPDGIRNVWLTPRTEGSASSTTSARVGAPPVRSLPPRLSDSERRIVRNRPPEETESPEPSVSTDAPPAVAQPAPTEAAPANTQPPPAATTDTVPASDTPGSEPNKPAATPTPATTPSANPTDQMIQTLQNMYEQRKQMNLARTPTTPN